MQNLSIDTHTMDAISVLEIELNARN